mmetsp:Transcript_80879/g.237739  ORF Transcript_80879/g.237739 Transcript_80879/m.237739 type:complete len:248 (-) Transcript_80879:433-1176(-)
MQFALLGLVRLQVTNGDNGLLAATARGSTDELCKRVPVFQVFWVLLPGDGPIAVLFSEDGVALASLQDQVGAASGGVHILAYSLDILADLRYLLVCLGMLGTGGVISGFADGEDSSDDLLAIMLLGRADVQGAELVHAEPEPVLGRLVKYRLGRLQDMVEHGCFGQVVRAWLEKAAVRLGIMADLVAHIPGIREEWAWAVKGKLVGEEAFHPLLAHLLLTLHQAAKLLHVCQARVRRSEALTLVTAV